MLSDANVMRILRTHLQGRGMLESDLILHSVALCFGFWRLPALRRTAGLPDAESFLRQLAQALRDTDPQALAAVESLCLSHLPQDAFADLFSFWASRGTPSSYPRLVDRLLYPTLDRQYPLRWTPSWLSRLAVELLAPRGGVFYDGTAATGGAALEAARYGAAHGGLQVVTYESDPLLFHLSILRSRLQGLALDQRRGEILAPAELPPAADWSIMFPPLGDNRLRQVRCGSEVLTCTGDWAFALHQLQALKEGGRGLICLFSGSLFNSRNTAVRRYLLEQNFLEGIVSLPEGCLPRTMLPTSLVLLRKGRGRTDGIRMLDASDWMLVSQAGRDFRLSDTDTARLPEAFRASAALPAAGLDPENLLPKQYRPDTGAVLDSPDLGRVRVQPQPPESWQPLSGCTRIYRGVNLSRVDRNATAGPGVIRLADVQDGVLRTDSLQPSGLPPERAERYLVQPGDILVSCKGPTIKICLVPAMDRLPVLSDAFLGIRADPEKMDPRYIFYCLQSPAGQAGLARRQLGSSIPILRARDLEDVRLPYIPLSLQQQCVETLSREEARLDAQLARLQAEKKRAYATFYRQTGLQSVMEWEEHT